MDKKVCKCCGENKSLSMFRAEYTTNGVSYRSVCRECDNARRRNQRSKNKDTFRKVDNPTKKDVDIVTAFLDACDYRPDMISAVPEAKFLRCYHVHEDIDFDKLKQDALAKMRSLGYCSPSELTLDKNGYYLIIGDTFGKKTSTSKFKLLYNIANERRCNAIIVVGHNTDDYNDVSNCFDSFNIPVYFIPVKNELKDINEFCEGKDNLNIVLDSVTVGDLVISNQEHIQPYSKTPISSLDPVLYNSNKRVVNCTRHEYVTRTNTSWSDSFIASPGAMAEPHVVRVAYKLMLANGGRVNAYNSNSFQKYRKQEIDKSLWECGCILAFKDDEETMLDMVRIITNDKDNPSCVLQDGTYIDCNTVEILKPEVAVISDVHSPRYDKKIVDVCYKSLKKLKPASIYFNGDLQDSLSFNPHNDAEAMEADLESEVAETEALLKRFSEIAPCYFTFGNHENFMFRWLSRQPQLYKFVMNTIIDRYAKYAEPLSLDSNDVQYLCNNTVMTHGSNSIFGVNGNQLDKLARAVGEQLVAGHLHTPQIRLGVYMSGCLCDYDQGYNNPTTSNWKHGYILIFSKNGQDYIKQVLLP